MGRSSQLKLMKRFLLHVLLGLFVSPLSAQITRVTKIGETWPSASKTSILVLILFLVVGLIGFGSVMLWRYLRRKEENARLSWERFDMAALNHNLNNPEQETLRRIIHQSRVPDPESIFKNILSFEIGIARDINNHVSDRESLAGLAQTVASLRDKLGYSRLPEGTRLYSSRELGVGQPVAITFSKDPSDERIMTRVHDVSELELALSLPQDKQERVPSLPGTPLFCNLFQPKDAEYFFDSRLLRKDGSGHFLYITHVAEMGRRQLREFVRLDVKNEAAFRVVRSDAAPQVVKDAKRSKGLVIDIGGGGLNLRTVEELHINDVLLLSFSFLGESFFGVKGKVLRIMAKTVHGEPVFQNHLSFIEMENAAREKIIKLIFKKQREEIQWKT
ncbi:MAG: hypothetical protein A2293_14435 [Elusimicrobia bacterium RIFOXYB2_FULL_49_7]|nr:MAG: hypothetical protein A2293_14435 [Elusimicrobia bacterium RIFOXYB2_FULL_49_7]